MDINTIVLIIILAVILYAMVTNNQSKSQQAKELREQIIAEKETISKEEVAEKGLPAAQGASRGPAGWPQELLGCLEEAPEKKKKTSL